MSQFKFLQKLWEGVAGLVIWSLIISSSLLPSADVPSADIWINFIEISIVIHLEQLGQLYICQNKLWLQLQSI